LQCICFELPLSFKTFILQCFFLKQRHCLVAPFVSHHQSFDSFHKTTHIFFHNFCKFQYRKFITNILNNTNLCLLFLFFVLLFILHCFVVATLALGSQPKLKHDKMMLRIKVKFIVIIVTISNFLKWFRFKVDFAYLPHLYLGRIVLQTWKLQKQRDLQGTHCI
jgi:hypothetical protein